MPRTGWSRGNHKRSPEGLHCTFTLKRLEGVYHIYQGRLGGTMKGPFVYRLVRPDGTHQDFTYINDAKEAV